MGVREMLLIRHGESLGNVAAAEADAAGAHEIEVPERDADVDLSDLGTRQAQALGVALATMAEDARSLKPWRSRLGIEALAANVRP